MHNQELIPHLFRTEYSKITAVLCKLFGLEYIQDAEDIAGDTFLAALETWSYKGVPENPTAWLYAVAKNKARNRLKHDRIFADKVAGEMIYSSGDSYEGPDIDLSEKNIMDSQLRMMFAVCHPSISAESQIGLALRVLCGFGVEEIAAAFLTNKETINKRLFRAKEKLRKENAKIELPVESEINKRLETVLTAIYLLFNEGYYSESRAEILREDLCAEAMRLTRLLMENKRTNRPQVNALFALMCFHSSRFKARKNENGDLVLYQDQNEELWDKELISKGIYFLHLASQGSDVSKYHLEAAIAYWHTIKADTNEKWTKILTLYDQLLSIEYSPIGALNRTYALARTKGAAEAVVEAEKLNLTNNHFYFVLLGELYKDVDPEKARQNLEKAISLAKTSTDKRTIQMKLDEL